MSPARSVADIVWPTVETMAGELPPAVAAGFFVGRRSSSGALDRHRWHADREAAITDAESTPDDATYISGALHFQAATCSADTVAALAAVWVDSDVRCAGVDGKVLHENGALNGDGAEARIAQAPMPAAALIIRTSESDGRQGFWSLDRYVDVDEIDDVLRAMRARAEKAGLDTSVYRASQWVRAGGPGCRVRHHSSTPTLVSADVLIAEAEASLVASMPRPAKKATTRQPGEWLGQHPDALVAALREHGWTGPIGKAKTLSNGGVRHLYRHPTASHATSGELVVHSDGIWFRSYSENTDAGHGRDDRGQDGIGALASLLGTDISGAASWLRRNYPECAAWCDVDKNPFTTGASGPQSAQDAFGEDRPAWLLPDEFWTSRRDLDHIRQAALSRSISPDAVLGAVLARAVSMTHRAITIPPGARRVGLEFFAALVAGPGIGKGAAMDCARDLIPNPADHPGGWIEAPIGSGEGLVKLFFGLVDEINPATGKTRTVQRQVRFNVMIRIDEVETLVRLAKRQDQTTMTTLRTAWSGEALGGSYSDDGKDRRVPRLAYRLGVVIGVQPAVAGPIFDDADGGTPQRFSWFSVAYPPMPDLPPAWPGSLYWAPPVPDWGDHELFRDVTVAPVAVAQMRADHLAAVRGAVVDPLSAHSNLRRLKTAVALAVLAGRLDVNPEDWALAGTMATTSDAVRDSIRSGLAAEGRARVEQQVNLAGRKRTAERLAESTFDDDARSKRIEQAVAIIVTRLTRETEPIAWRVLRDALNSRLRSVATDARVIAAERGLIVEVPDGWQVAPL